MSPPRRSILTARGCHLVLGKSVVLALGSAVSVYPKGDGG